VALARLHSWLCHGANGQTFEQRDWQLVYETGMDERTVRRAKRELERAKYIEISKEAARKPTTYNVLYPME